MVYCYKRMLTRFSVEGLQYTDDVEGEMGDVKATQGFRKLST